MIIIHGHQQRAVEIAASQLQGSGRRTPLHEPHHVHSPDISEDAQSTSAATPLGMGTILITIRKGNIRLITAIN